jgi:glycosyltransferase involved in cell wall biosynthesis
VQPLIDGKSVDYVGFVRGAERDRFLGGARALLYPIQYPEAFGLVQIEAMLCGTPVAALRVGAVAEIVDDGVSGFSVEALTALPEALGRCLLLDRRRVRQQAEKRFSLARMAGDYLRVYEAVLARQNFA